jgi:hypothetical protein
MLFPRSQQDLGTTGTSKIFRGSSPANDLPIFELSCKAGASTQYLGSVVRTNDPGLALITGKCADIGKVTVPRLRGLAARTPYFHDGSAATLLDVVNFYDLRFFDRPVGAGQDRPGEFPECALICSGWRSWHRARFTTG